MPVFSDGMLLGGKRLKEPVTFRGATSSDRSGTNWASINYSATGVTPVAGNLMVAVLYANSAGATVTPPAGWTEVFQSGAGVNGKFYVYTRVVVSETSTGVFAWSSSRTGTMALLCYDAGTVVQTGAENSLLNSTSLTALSFTPTENGVLLALFGAVANGRTVSTAPSGMTQRVSGGYLFIYELSPSGPSATGDKTLVVNASTSSLNLQIQIIR